MKWLERSKNFILVSRNAIAHGIYILVDSSGKMAGIEQLDLFPGLVCKDSMIVRLKSYMSFKKKKEEVKFICLIFHLVYVHRELGQV